MNKDEQYQDLLETELFINSTSYYNNEILQIGLSRYSEYLYGLSEPYCFKSDEKHHVNLGCIYSRSRNNVVLEAEDIKGMFERQLSKWMQTAQNKNAVLAENRGELGKNHLVVRQDSRGIEVLAMKPIQRSIKKPLVLQGVRCSYALPEDFDYQNPLGSDREFSIYSFHPSDIDVLKEELTLRTILYYSQHNIPFAIRMEQEKNIPLQTPGIADFSHERLTVLFSNALNWIAEQENGSELYYTLHDILKMTNGEIEQVDFNLKEHYDNEQDDEDLEP